MRRKPLQVEAERREVRVPEAARVVDGRGRGLVHPVVVARELALEGDRNQEVAPLDAIPSLLLDQTLGAGEPTACGADVAADCERHPEPARARRRGEVVARVDVREVRTLEDGQVLVHAPHQRGRGRQQLEVGRAERGDSSAFDNAVYASSHSRPAKR